MEAPLGRRLPSVGAPYRSAIIGGGLTLILVSLVFFSLPATLIEVTGGFVFAGGIVMLAIGVASARRRT